ncbi:MAG: 30S ribosomal protein S10 [Candidatus Liptonbacteria bacterium]|nr:30S ribosomal protein S10 [Candidatus Liptonbacteria bacterium]
MASRKEAPAEAQSKIRLKVRGYDNKLVDNSCRQIIDTAERENATVVGPIPLPTETKHYTVNRSTFVHKDSRDQFELRVHKRLIDIMNPTQSTVESLSSLNLPAGVSIEIRVA